MTDTPFNADTIRAAIDKLRTNRHRPGDPGPEAWCVACAYIRADLDTLRAYLPTWAYREAAEDIRARPDDWMPSPELLGHGHGREWELWTLT